ncbi:MAG: pentapeptide repeat-containing protein [Synechococcus sp.]
MAFALHRKCPPNVDGERELDECTIVGVTILEWLKLLVVPLVLACFGRILDQVQRRSDNDKAKEKFLLNYFDSISELIIEKDIISLSRKFKYKYQKYQEPSILSSSRTLIEARTKSVLRRCRHDSEKTRIVLKFLSSAGIYTTVKPKLAGIDLESLNLSGIHLSGIDLSEANLINIDLRDADLSMANLKDTDLRGADLRGADLRDANLAEAKLDGILYNSETKWPIKITPPLSRDGYQAAKNSNK